MVHVTSRLMSKRLRLTQQHRDANPGVRDGYSVISEKQELGLGTCNCTDEKILERKVASLSRHNDLRSRGGPRRPARPRHVPQRLPRAPPGCWNRPGARRAARGAGVSRPPSSPFPVRQAREEEENHLFFFFLKPPSTLARTGRQMVDARRGYRGESEGMRPARRARL